MPKEKSRQNANMDGAAFDRSDEEITYMDTTDNVIYLAGGCFWGMEQLMQSIPGVIDAESGYANGTCEADADYQTVCAGNTGFRETVRVEYDPEQVSLDALLLAYFYVIDPTVQNRQGNDRGSQYQTGVYYTNESARETVKRIAEIERGRSEKFFVEIGPLKNYYPAEEYHQNYLEKNPNGYCHIPRAEMELFSKLRIDPGLRDALHRFSRAFVGEVDTGLPPGGDGALFPAAHRPGRLSEARGGVHSGQADGGAVPRHAGERHGARFHRRVLGQV